MSNPNAAPTPVIAIFDIGKTNKKLFLFNERYEIVWQKTEQFAEGVDDDGYPCENLKKLTRWITSSLEIVMALPDFDIRALNFQPTEPASSIWTGRAAQLGIYIIT